MQGYNLEFYHLCQKCSWQAFVLISLHFIIHALSLLFLVNLIEVLSFFTTPSTQKKQFLHFLLLSVSFFSSLVLSFFVFLLFHTSAIPLPSNSFHYLVMHTQIPTQTFQDFCHKLPSYLLLYPQCKHSF